MFFSYKQGVNKYNSYIIINIRKFENEIQETKEQTNKRTGYLVQSVC